MAARHISDNGSGDWLEGDDVAPIPQVSEDLFHVPVTENASADEAARLRVEEIMRELEEELKRPQPVGAHARVEKEQDQEVSAGEREALAETTVVPVVSSELLETGDIDEPEMQDSAEGSDGPDDAEDDSAESTLILDRGKLGSSLREREATDEELDERKRERLRVNPNPQDARRETGLSVVPKEEPRRRFGFFAAIGEFVARLLHLDDH